MAATPPLRVVGSSRCHPAEGPCYEPATDTAWSADILANRLFERPLSKDAFPSHEETPSCSSPSGSWTPCSGSRARRRARASRRCALQNDSGLDAEEVAEDDTFIGNFPRASSHPGFIHNAPMLGLYEHGGRAEVGGTDAVRSLRETEMRRAPCIDGAEMGE